MKFSGFFWIVNPYISFECDLPERWNISILNLESKFLKKTQLCMYIRSCASILCSYATEKKNREQYRKQEVPVTINNGFINRCSVSLILKSFLLKSHFKSVKHWPFSFPLVYPFSWWNSDEAIFPFSSLSFITQHPENDKRAGTWGSPVTLILFLFHMDFLKKTPSLKRTTEDLNFCLNTKCLLVLWKYSVF